MAKLSARRCETERPDKSGKDKLPGDGDGLLLRITPRGTKTWIIDYEFHSRHRKCKLEAFELAGGPDTDIGQWLTHGSLSPGQARSIAARSGRPIVAQTRPASCMADATFVTIASESNIPVLGGDGECRHHAQSAINCRRNPESSAASGDGRPAAFEAIVEGV